MLPTFEKKNSIRSEAFMLASTNDSSRYSLFFWLYVIDPDKGTGCIWKNTVHKYTAATGSRPQVTQNDTRLVAGHTGTPLDEDGALAAIAAYEAEARAEGAALLAPPETQDRIKLNDLRYDWSRSVDEYHKDKKNNAENVARDAISNAVPRPLNLRRIRQRMKLS